MVTAMNRFLALLMAACALLTASCAGGPGAEGLVSAARIVDQSIPLSLSHDEVRARLGAPTVTLGPGQVYVYTWTVHNGAALWLLGGSGTAPGEDRLLMASHLFFVAFDNQGRVARRGSAMFDPGEAIPRQAAQWLARGDVQIAGSPGIDVPPDGTPRLILYRPEKSACPMFSYDTDTLKPSVAINGHLVGEVAKGQYLVTETGTGPYLLTLDPQPGYRHSSQDQGAEGSEPVSLQLAPDASGQIFVEAYLCAGVGRLKTHLAIESPGPALKQIADMKPAW